MCSLASRLALYRRLCCTCFLFVSCSHCGTVLFLKHFVLFSTKGSELVAVEQVPHIYRRLLLKLRCSVVQQHKDNHDSIFWLSVTTDPQPKEDNVSKPDESFLSCPLTWYENSLNLLADLCTCYFEILYTSCKC